MFATLTAVCCLPCAGVAAVFDWFSSFVSACGKPVFFTDDPPGAAEAVLRALPTVPPDSKVYQDGVLVGSRDPDFSRDVKIVIEEPAVTHLVNLASGYEVNLPAGSEFDFRYSPAYVRATTAELDIKISKERSPYQDVQMYLRDYPNRFIARKDFATYRYANGIEIIEDEWQTLGENSAWLTSFRREPAPPSTESENEYLFAYILTGGLEFFTLFFRTSSLERNRDTIQSVLESFSRIEPLGRPQFNLRLAPKPGEWNEETQALYEALCAPEQFVWGIFYPWALTNPEAYQKIECIEQNLGYSFEILLHYLYVADAFPLEAMQQAYERGQIVQLTMQVASFDNEMTDLRSAQFDVLDGRLDETLRQFARDARTFGHPFLFRLNNEMNTDWAQYSGVRTLSDVDVYIKVWRRIYHIFSEEGVQNAIWVFNPNDRSYPPMNWNHHVAYFPGNEYVHVIGLTGYNTGDYFHEVTAERWRSFEEIYEPLVRDYRRFYAEFPWIITEFASSSVGGDKQQWIRDMFRTLPRYPEIRAAVWWSYADYDYRPENQGVPGRRYWLDEQQSYLDAFREGLEMQGLIR